MEYRKLGRTSLQASAMGIGTWQLSGPLTLDGKADGFPDIGEAEAVALIQACEDLGINFIDSAEIYGDGEGERRIGIALQGRRDRWLISTKFGLRRGESGQRITNSRPETIRPSLENSLKRLQTDYVDLYLYHSPPDHDGIETGREVLEALKQEGKIRFYGISTDDAGLVRELAGKNAVDAVMFSQSLLTHSAEMREVVKTHELGGILRGALESGLLSGRYFRQAPALSNADIRQAWFDSLETQRYAVYEQFLPPGASMTAFALRYLLDFDTTHTIVLGGKSLEDYQAALKAFELPPLTAATQMEIQSVRQQFFKRSLKQRVLGKIRRIFAR
ncbi:MAG: aldo/keto reductase [Thermosynechococcaceae cyanobacterium MS004]|nr:aldo/keto reductase [Thermosynechococcaceae cyanobacterium MS004]